MATPYAIATGDPQAVKLWSQKMMIATLQKTYYSKFSSTRGDMPIQVLTDLSKGSGDQIKYDLLTQMSGYGVSKNTQLIGDFPAGISAGGEQNLVYHQDSINVEQKRFGHSWFRMSNQRTIHDLREDSKQNLSDRWAFIMDRYVFMHLVGGTATVANNATFGDDTLLTDINTTHGANAVVAQDAGHIMSALATGAFSTEHIDQARWKAETITSPAPLKKMTVDGVECYVLFIRPEQAYALQQDADWKAAQEMAGERGANNKMFTGALGMWNNTVLHVSTFIPTSSTANASDRYGILCGKQAATVAFGNAFDTLDQERYGKEFIFAFVDREVTDYGNAKGVSAGAIYGVKRVIFNSLTHGCVRVDSRDAAI